MENKNLIAKAEVRIEAGVQEVWRALTDPATIQQYMFGTTVETDWQEGSAIVWRGEWKGKPYEDKGKITALHPGKQLQYTHFSGASGMEDSPENYHTVTIRLAADGEQTRVTLEQDGNGTEQGREESAKNWQMMLDSMKRVLEKGG